VVTASHPRTFIALLAASLAASFAGPHSAVVALLCAAIAAPPSARGLGLRALALVGSLGTLLIVLPFAPRAVTDVALRGVAASLALVFFGSSLPWPAAVAELQRFGLPRAAVAFLTLLARHVEVLAEDARSVVAVLKVRGAFERRSMPRSVVVLLSRLLALAWERADRVADAMALRGFDGRLPPNPAWRPRLHEVRQYGLALVMVAAATWELTR